MPNMRDFVVKNSDYTYLDYDGFGYDLYQDVDGRLYCNQGVLMLKLKYVGHIDEIDKHPKFIKRWRKA